MRKVSIGLSCVRMSRIDSFINRFHLYLVMPRDEVSFSEISAINLIVRWKLLACSMKRLFSCWLESHRENMS